ncbi:MAG: tRNA (adenosine(37)-N6)-threonylcarbamoyltransferase complex ATPase subunit type 1 TsaE [Nitrospirae bacterium]|nr:tRNA (adenosine(37)-N6)-threonylcarbamoyltransferase complex ATPase subunit type 1 TsaE [Nitrospirota bacterium]
MRSNKSPQPNGTKPAKAQPPVARRSAAAILPWKLLSSSSQQTDRLGQALGRTLRGGETIALYGPLGAGKTALVRGIAQGLGAAPEAVTSPTFVVIHEYQGRLPLAHMDWYRITSLRELESTGVIEYFSGQTVTAIEWADKGLALLPQDRIEITLSHRAEQSRTIQLRATGPASGKVLALTRQAHRTAPNRVSNKKGTTKS